MTMMSAFLRLSTVIDCDHPEVVNRATILAIGSDDQIEIARRCFEWVRDEIQRSRDFGLRPVTCTASEVLHIGSGYCYAKSHLLAAILRAYRIPAGLCYQRLSRAENGALMSLNGLNAFLLPESGWYRIYQRGNRAGIDARFEPPVDQLAFPIAVVGEGNLPGIYVEPMPEIVNVLCTNTTADDLWESQPDIEPD